LASGTPVHDSGLDFQGVTPGVRSVQTHIAINPAASITIFSLFFVALWCVIGLVVGRISGWATLERRFASTLPFPGQTWRWRSARMRWGANYNNCLVIGGDPAGLYLSSLFFLRIGHPPLFIPWTEISVRSRRKIMFIECVEFKLGREEQIPFLIRAGLADQIRSAAASSWPVESIS
jgi:hypothetical protein